MLTSTVPSDSSTMAQRGAVSISVPRLADFSYANKSSLVSPVVLRGVFRTIDAVLLAAIGFVIA